MTLTKEQTITLAKILRKAQIRVTRQRIALLSALGDSEDHPDAFELHARTKKIDPSISLATVYRTLSLLEAHNVVHKHSFEGGSARFEIAKEEHHDHIVDVDTGAIIEFNSVEIERLQDEIAAHLGYKVIHHKMELYCRKLP
jgi:Fur family ferric uptake transcriptional regulator